MGKWLKALQILDSDQYKQVAIQYDLLGNNPNFEVYEYITSYIKENESEYAFINYSIVDDYKELKVEWEVFPYYEDYAYLGDFFWRDREGKTTWNIDWIDIMVEKIKENGLDYKQYINEFKESLIQRYKEDIQGAVEITQEGLKQSLKEQLNYLDEKYLNKSKSIENKELNKVNSNDDEFSM